MQIIDRECLACSSFCECGTEIGKGSLLWMSKRVTNKQTKGEMLQKMYDIEKATLTKGSDILEMLNIQK